MTKSSRTLSRWRRLSAGTTVVMLGLPALLAPPAALLLALAAVVAVVAALMRWPMGRISLTTASVATMGISLVADVAYTGPFGLTLLWMPFEMTALLVLTARLIRWSEPRYVIVLGIVAVVTMLALPLRFALRNPESGTAAVLALVLVTLLPVGCAAGVGGYLRATEKRRSHAVSQARKEQRLHMARMLHDYIAHELTGIVLEVQAARTTAYDPEQYHALLGRLEDSGLRALDSMDRTLQALREAEVQLSADHGDPESGRGQATAEPPTAEPPTRMYGLADLEDLVTRFAESSSIRTELTMPQDLVGALPREVDESAYSLVLEALTNVRRHAAQSSLVNVEVDRPDGGATVRVTVTDDGGQSAPLHAQRQGGGTGLAGLQERLSVLGGVLSTGPVEHGWRVSGSLPVLSRPRAAVPR